MATIKKGEHIQDIRGGVKNHVYSDWRGKGYLRSKAINPLNPRSFAQANSRARMPACSTYWSSTLTDEQRAQWNEYAQQENKLKVKRPSKAFIIPPPKTSGSGFNTFVRNNMLLQSVGILAHNQFLSYPPTLAGIGKPNPPTSLSGVWVNTPLSRCVRLDGVNEYITFGDIAPIWDGVNSKMSLSFWIYQSSLSDGFPFTKYNTASVLSGMFYVKTYATGKIGIAFWGATPADSRGFFTGDGVMSSDVTYHVQFVVDLATATAQIYINDADRYAVTSASGVPPVVFLDTNVPFEVGRFRTAGSPGGTGWFRGQLDEPILYDYLRTQAQAIADYNEGAGVYGVRSPGLVAGWHFDQAAGIIAPDFSCNDYDGTLHNMEVGDWQPGLIQSPQRVSLAWVDPLEVPAGSRVRLWTYSDRSGAHLQTIRSHRLGCPTFPAVNIRGAQGKTFTLSALPGRYQFQADCVDTYGQQSMPSNLINVEVL